MYELPIGVGLIPALQTEGTALVSALTLVGAAWMAVFVVLYLVVIPLASRTMTNGTSVTLARPSAAPRLRMVTDRWHRFPGVA